MKGDFTRDTFDRTHEFYRVLLQQGRVQLDADWNEQIAILLHRFETLIVDVFGPHGGPAIHCGFAVYQDDEKQKLWHLSRGRYYVEGLQCENTEIVELKLPRSADDSEHPAYLVYLDVFEQYVSAAQDPAIADVALGGLDTAGRSRICWTVKYWPLAHAPTDDDTGVNWRREWEQTLPEIVGFKGRGLLRARASSQFGYTGSQNQLYRVEVHQGGTSEGDGDATWKWSRENGSVAFAVTRIDGLSVELQAGPRAAGAIVAGDWVEITTNADREDCEHARQLHRVTDVPSSAAITLDSPPGRTFESSEHPIVRRWDQRHFNGKDLESSGGCLPLIEDAWLPLEFGIHVCFTRPGADEAPHRYRGGDYWMIPARTATAAIEWPTYDKDDSAALAPHGITHRYAPLAGLVFSNGALARKPYDFRVRYKPPSMMP